MVYVRLHGRAEMTERHTVLTDDGRKMSYLVDGHGPGLLLLPGLWQSARDWDEVGYVARYASSYRVVALDLLGQGHSEASTDPVDYGSDATMARIGAVMEHAGLSSACVWGYSSGADAALLLARRRPDLVDGVICGGVYLDDYAKGLRSRGIEPEQVVERAAAALDEGDWPAYFDALPVQLNPGLREWIASTNDADTLAAITRAELQRPRGFLKPTVPTFAYWAEGDQFASDNARIAETLPIDWAVVPGTHLDGFRGIEVISRAVEGFLGSLVKV